MESEEKKGQERERENEENSETLWFHFIWSRFLSQTMSTSMELFW
jgi:hypothetical protein